MYASINGVDITHYINRKKYKINEEIINHSEWQDANGKYHEGRLRTRVMGSIDLEFYEPNAYADFLGMLNNATDANNVLTITLFIQNGNETREIHCYYTLTNTSHLDYDLDSGAVIDKATLEIREQ